ISSSATDLISKLPSKKLAELSTILSTMASLSTGVLLNGLLTESLKLSVSATDWDYTDPLLNNLNTH
ncbi:hypothetical protein U9P13_26890, partial [Klebsiella pneumoniae]